ncbi:hypothetical protein CHLNCDRAFT_59486 [Chlorella variabilis]|uniref:BRCA2 OB1 domain-containing protein n=1 Tax=Chlorella variabilis TaxID=554065 RepID=E1ZU95_CHLVA|nr:hypothetical protein CHLNCDRAFT_59486 [Chlorella variabilis]EFN50600.1 hypothetical protein CHLNCDRAFT_59486 [Chlorella variabilis]|eukprot:XP_005842725.1 hypothetical protein CHLNCDRAFT_59486 [Chlorella variabilis]
MQPPHSAPPAPAPAPASPATSAVAEDTDEEATTAAAALVRAAFAAVLAGEAGPLQAGPTEAAGGPQQAPQQQQWQQQQQQQQQQQEATSLPGLPQHPPWLLAVQLVARPAEVDWLDPASDPGSIFTLSNVWLDRANAEVRLWNAGGDECCAIQRHKPGATLAASRGRARGGGGGSGSCAATEAATAGVAAWAAANPQCCGCTINSQAIEMLQNDIHPRAIRQEPNQFCHNAGWQVASGEQFRCALNARWSKPMLNTPMNADTFQARQLQAAEAAALRDRQCPLQRQLQQPGGHDPPQQQEHQPQAPPEQQQAAQPAGEAGAAVGEAEDTPMAEAEPMAGETAPLSGSKRGREKGGETAPAATAATAAPAGSSARASSAAASTCAWVHYWPRGGCQGVAAHLKAAQQQYGGDNVAAGQNADAGSQGHEAQQGAACTNQQRPADAHLEEQVQVLGFSTGRGGAVNVSAARLKAAQQQYGGGDEAAGGEADGGSHAAEGEQPGVEIEQPGVGQALLVVEGQEKQQGAQPVAAQVLGFSTGRGGAVKVSAARLKTAQQQYGEGDEAAGGQADGGSHAATGEQPGAGQALVERQEKQQGAQPAAVQVLGFSTGRGGAVNVSAARLKAAQQQFGGGGAENASENEGQQATSAAAAAGESTPLLRKQLLRSRVSLGGSDTPAAAAPAAEGAQTPAAGLPAAAAGGPTGGAATTPASAPQLGKVAALRRLAPGAASTGLLKGKRKAFQLPVAGSSRKFKPPGKTAVSRLGGGGGGGGGELAGAPPHPAVQLHDLQGSILKRLLASSAAAAAGAAAATPPAGPGAEAAARCESVERGGQQEEQQQQQLPLDSTTCSEFRVTDLQEPAVKSGDPTVPAPVADATSEAPAGANSAYATASWVQNQYRWVVWKLARLQLLLAGSGSSAPASLLTAAVVLDELKLRYEREFNRGHRPLLKALLQQDEVASAAMVLMVAAVLLPAPGSGGLVLTDGWYWIRASGDERLTLLARRGCISQGTKLHICGAELASPGPADPLEAAATAVLRIGANSAHPAPAGAKLGRLRQRGVFVPLSRFDEAGGTLPQMLVVVHRIFPRLTCSWFPDGGRSVQTPRQLAALLRSHEGAEERIGAEVMAEVQRREVQQCQEWLRCGKAGSMSHVDRIYATMVVEQAAAGGGGGEAGALGRLNQEDERALQQ